MNLTTKFLAGLFVLTPLQLLMFWPVALLLALFVHPVFALGAAVPWIVALFAQRDSIPTTDSKDVGPEVRRANLPQRLRWFETNDERLPGGFYEGKMARLYERTANALYDVIDWVYRLSPPVWRPMARAVEPIAFWFTSGAWLSRNKLYTLAQSLGAVIDTNEAADVVTKGVRGRLGWENPGVAVYLVKSTPGKVLAWEVQVQFPYPEKLTRLARITDGQRLGFMFRMGWKIEPLRWKPMRQWNDPLRADQMFTFSPRPITKLERGYQ